MFHNKVELDEVTIRFAGDSGDGMQLTGMQFTTTTASFGNDLSTFPDYPAEIRAPQGTVGGVSGFQIHFGSKRIHNPGDAFDVLVAMNAAALKANIQQLKKGGMVIVNTAGFDPKNLRLSKSEATGNPLENGSLAGFQVIEIDITNLTKEALKETSLSTKDIDRSKNMFVLGLLFWLYDRPLEATVRQLQAKFKSKPDIADANIAVLQAGWSYGETTEVFPARFSINPAKMPVGNYRNITGNTAVALGLIAAGNKSGLKVFLGSYPITPASDILHELSRHKNYDVITYQAEDEIAGITSAIGAAFGGSLGVTTSSGPGIALKTEAMGLAMMLELPLLIINVQRGGPSTGLPTKTEQADLLQAIYGRNGEAPIPVVAPATPSDCFNMIFEAANIAIRHMTPVIFLSDAYLANGSEPWLFPTAAELPEIEVKFAKPNPEEDFLPYKRNDFLSRPWSVPGVAGLEHRIGGLEKQHETGNISYDPANHEFMVHMRAEKIKQIENFIPEQTVFQGNDNAKLLVLGWGGTFGIIRTAVEEMINEGYDVAQAHVKYLHPFPKNMDAFLRQFDQILIPELNNGQMVRLIRDQFLVPAIPYNKIQGLPFTTSEIKNKIFQILNANTNEQN